MGFDAGHPARYNFGSMRRTSDEPQHKRASSPKEPVVIEAKDPSRQPGELKRIGGSMSDDWNNRIANDTVCALWLKNSDEATRKRQLSAAIAGLVGIDPRDELEGMMAAQLIAAHSAAMECYRRAMIPEQTFEGRHEALNQANKLTRSFSALLDTLNRHRGKGQQKVTVEHVHVHSGGQAIVGNVEGRGEGNGTNEREPPHARQHAPESPLRGTDATREPVSVARDGERPLPDARRTVTGRTER
jgi:hypothetical protein